MPDLKLKLRAAAAQPVVWVLALGLGIRIYNNLATAVVNPDGLLYIFQAQAIYYGQWDEITACQLLHLSILPPLISAAYLFLGDWVTAGRFVSLAFGFATLIPLYCILKRFLERAAVLTALLTYAFIPALVGRSADIIRDPIFWFFLSWALLMFVRHFEGSKFKRLDHNLLLSGMFFLAATAARTEGVVFIALSVLYLAVAGGQGRLRRLFWFLMPLLVLMTAGLATALFLDLPLAQILRLDKYMPILQGLITNYQSMRSGAAALARTQTGPFRYFLEHVGDFVWIVPLGPMLDVMAEKFFYPYVLIFLAGFCGLRQRVRTQSGTLYFLLLCVGATGMLYLYLLATWLIYDRFLVNLILPAVVFVGYGCDNLLRWLQARFHLNAKTAVVVLSLFILVFGLGKNLRPRYAEKAIFPQIAEAIVQRKAPGELVRIAAADVSNAYEWVFFYANRDVQAAVCASAQIGSIGDSYTELITSLRTNQIRFVLWSDKSWSNARYPLAASYKDDFEVIGQWRYNGKETFRLLALR